MGNGNTGVLPCSKIDFVRKVLTATHAFNVEEEEAALKTA